MITIKDFMETVEYKISEGSKYQWDCYGNSAWTLTHEDYPRNTTIFIVFDTEDQTVYEMQAWDGLYKREYRWINKQYINAHTAECVERGVPVHQSIDDRNYIELEVEEDMIEKATAIFKGLIYDERVQVQLDLSKDELLSIMTMAHKKDMTLNAFVEHILIEFIRKQEEQGKQDKQDSQEILVA